MSIYFLIQFLHLLFIFDSNFAYILSTNDGISYNTFSLTLSSIVFYDLHILGLSGLNLTVFLFFVFSTIKVCSASATHLADLSYKLDKYYLTYFLKIFY